MPVEVATITLVAAQPEAAVLQEVVALAKVASKSAAASTPDVATLEEAPQ